MRYICGIEIARQSSSRLSRSSSSLLSSSIRLLVKNDVGGSCFGSPTITTFSPLAIVPTASLVGSCDASSNITRSNFGNDGSIYCATEIGLISIHGQSLLSSVGILSNSFLSGIILPLFLIAFFSIPISEDAALVPSDTGIFADNLAASSCIVSL